MKRPDADYQIDMSTEIHTSVPEHQILLSFNSDSVAELFAEWWGNEGEQTFMAFMDEKDSDESA